MPSYNETVNRLNDLLLEVEEVSNEFTPIESVIQPVKEDYTAVLSTLQDKIKNSEDDADKIFYLNRYIDLIKRLESVFDAKSKRLQNILQTISKIPAKQIQETDDDKSEKEETSSASLTPEQCSKIIDILRNDK